MSGSICVSSRLSTTELDVRVSSLSNHRHIKVTVLYRVIRLLVMQPSLNVESCSDFSKVVVTDKHMEL